MGLKQIGQNTTEEFFETLIYMVAYEEATKMIKNFTEDIENPYLREAVESAANVAIFGGIFMIIQYEEQIIEKVFNIANGIISGLLFLPKKAIGKLKGLKGRKLSLVSKVLSGFNDDAVGKAQVVTSQLNNFISGRNNQYQSMNLLDGSQQIRKTVFQKEDISFRLANAMASRYNETLIFKLLTATFSEQDKTILKKILGTYNPDNLDINDLNKISEFMFVKDSDGKIIGLSEAFFELINGLGYVNK
jgi:hypothetical protein